MKPVQMITRSILAVCMFSFAGAASCEGGDIANNHLCPDGEVCVPNGSGLEFHGAIEGDDYLNFSTGVKVLAQGGSQIVRIYDAKTGQPYEQPYDVSVDANLGSVTASNANLFILKAAADSNGAGYLRVTDRATGELVDRLRISVAPVIAAHTTRSLSDVLAELPVEELPWVAPGGSVYVGLKTATGTAVDEAMVLQGDGTHTKWDRFVVGNPAPGTMQVKVQRGAQPTQVLNLTVVAAPDSIHKIFTLPAETPRNTSKYICFSARKQSHVVHVPWRFESNNGTIIPDQIDGCASVTAANLGPINITLHAGAYTETITSMVVPAPPSARVSPKAELRAALATRGHQVSMGDSRGERAKLQP